MRRHRNESRRRCEAALRALAEFPECSIQCPHACAQRCRITGVSPRRRVVNLLAPGGMLQSMCYAGAAKVRIAQRRVDLLSERGALVLRLEPGGPEDAWSSFVAAHYADPPHDVTTTIQ